MQHWSADEDVCDYIDEKALGPGSRWYVSCDGVQTQSVDGSWNEVKVMCLYRDYPQLSVASVPRAQENSLQYVASRSDAATFGEQWFQLATESGIYKAESIDEVVIGDGAAWTWNLVDEYFPGAVEIVDYMNVTSYLYDITKQIFGEDAGEAVERWVKNTEALLYDDNIRKVVAGKGMQKWNTRFSI